MKLALLAVAALLAQADAGVNNRVRITVRAIAASNDSATAAGVDPKLAPVAARHRELRRAVPLSQLQAAAGADLRPRLEGARADGAAGQPQPAAHPAPARQRRQDQVHLELLGEHPAHSRKLHTDYAIARGGTILVGGIRVDPQDEKAGKLLIAITQEMEK